LGPKHYFLRHGETDWNAEARLQGQKDIPLNDLGRRQARRNGEVLARLFEETGAGETDFLWLCSPLSRCRETMEIAREAIGLPTDGYRIEPRLIEISYGAWEGSTTKEIKQRDRPSIVARRENKWAFTPPGGESYQQLSRRIADWYATLAEDAVIVSHGGVSRVLRGILGEVDDLDVPMLEVPQDRVLEIDADGYRWR